MSEIPRTSGVYQIRCIPTGKVYVGSAINVQARWYGHQRALRSSRHHNAHLQAAWDKYGAGAFEFTVLELAAASARVQREQIWIDKTLSCDPARGFNVYPAGHPGGASQVWEGFIDPTGKEVTIFNLFRFCREHGLDWPSMHRLAMGKSKLKSYKGWRHKNSVRKRNCVQTYAGFISPDGTRVGSITNLAAFCRERRLDKTHMVAVAHGRLHSHRGWTYDNERQNSGIKTYANFVDPSGTRVTITNLAAFCREHGLHPVRMHQLKSGQRKSHKGWTWREPDG